MKKPPNYPEDKTWKNYAFFAIYDGHGGISVANYLRDNFHHLVALLKIYLSINLF